MSEKNLSFKEKVNPLFSLSHWVSKFLVTGYAPSIRVLIHLSLTILIFSFQIISRIQYDSLHIISVIVDMSSIQYFQAVKSVYSVLHKVSFDQL